MTTVESSIERGRYENKFSTLLQLHVHGVKSKSTGVDIVETPVVDNQNVPLLAMFDMTKVNKQIKEYVSNAFENMKGNLTVNIKKEIKDYFDDMEQGSTDAISKEELRKKTLKKEIKDYFDDMKQISTDAIYEALTARDCSDLDRKNIRSGVYKIFPESRAGFNVYCDMETDGGGWTMENVLFLVDAWFLFVDNERISCFGFTHKNSLGDALVFHNKHAFSTKDKDNDSSSSNCAELYKGAWWYGNCYHSNLNGLYVGNKHDDKGMGWKGSKSMKTTSMMIRRI
ncbi:FCN [Mytilus edulis]|uniref:FCN n=1 Tax=Mytilus edulis TaxID=6550 RepID=A0A8S3TDD7_MYTED|nr:FCN [Mytilus edulis]